MAKNCTVSGRIFILCSALSFALKLFGQTPTTPKLVPDGPITKLEYSPNLGLLMAGDFRYVGYPAQNMAIVDNGLGNPAGNFPFLKVTSNADKREVIADGSGGWYVVANRETYGTGTFAQRTQHIWYDSTNRMRTFDCVTHVLANNSLDTTFRINSNTANYKIINIQSVVLYKSVLYAWCELADAQGNSFRRKLLGIDARNGNIIWDPNTNHRIDKPLGGMTLIGRNLFIAGAINVINGQPVTQSSLCYNLNTRQLTAWNPLSTDDYSCNGCGPTGLSGYNNKVIIKVLVAGNRDYSNLTELIASDTLSATLWRRQMGPLYNLVGVALNDTVGYYHSYEFGNNPESRKINKIRLTDGQTVKTFPYPSSTVGADTSSMYVGSINGLVLQDKYLYIYGNATDGFTVRRSAIQVDITTFRPTEWKPFGERSIEEFDVPGNPRNISALAYQGNKVFLLGDFKLLKLNYAPKLVAIDPIANTLRWRPRINLNDFNQNGSIYTATADGDSLVWVVQGYGAPVFTAFDARTGFKIRNFTLSPQVVVNNIVAVSDRLYIQGNFSSLQGFAVNNGFGVLSKTGAPFPWEPIFPVNQGQVNKMVVQGDHIYLGGRFTANNGSQNLAIINRFTGIQTSWKAEMPKSRYGSEYEVKDFLVQGDELFTVWQNGGPPPGEYRKVSLSTGKVTATYSYTTCGTADKLLAKDRYVFINENYCLPYGRESLSYFDQSSNKFSNKPILAKYSIQLPGDVNRDYLPNPSDMAFVGNKLYLTPNYGDGNGSTSVLPLPSLMAIDFPKGFFTETVEYFPKAGGNAGYVTVNFYGYNLTVGSRVKLTRAGQESITVLDSLLTFPDPFRMQAVFNLRGRAVGEWNIEITTPAGELVYFPHGFTINQAKVADIQVWLNAPSSYRLGSPIKFIVSVANRGDMDAYMIPIWVAVPNSSTLEASTKTRVKNRLVNSDTLYLIEIDSIAGIAYKGLVAWIATPIVKAGQVIEIPITLKSTNGGFIDMHVFAGEPLSQDLPVPGGRMLASSALDECLKAIIPPIENKVLESLIPDIPFEDCYKDLLTSMNNYRNWISGITETQDLWIGYGSAAWACIGDPLTTILFPERIVINKVGNVLADLMGHYSDVKDAANGLLDCFPLFKPNPKKEQPAKIPQAVIRPISSLDPNDKLGPFGVKAERYVSGKEPFNYLIRFENDTAATADAQIVRIIDTLDRSKFDYNTFQLGYFNVADTTFYVPPGRKQCVIDWDLRPSKNLVLRMEARFNDTTGILTSTYTALDPITRELTEDVLMGFLPPNRKAPQGEGGLAFSISPKASLINLNSVKNTAHIYFDYNAPIPTPTWTNTLDKGLPQSSMRPLSTNSHSTTVTLGWHGTDAESGPKLYDIFVSVNGGSYQPILTATRDSSFQFVGRADSTYRFYSVAYDSVYNQELIPIAFDTETTIRLNIAAIQSMRSGNWSDVSTWSCGCIPTESDDVVIKATHTILLDSTMPEAACRNLELLGTFSMQGSSILINGSRIVIDPTNVITR